jgi:DNA-binding winged helix-turn-helix (wHTH) protein/TolB-like protein
MKKEDSRGDEIRNSEPRASGRTPSALLRFGDFEFDTGTEELREHGQPVPLRPQSTRLLSLLLRDPGRLMTREDIQRALWPSGTLDSEQGINACVREIRYALRDDARAPAFVETVPKRGYRFIAPVEELATENRAPTGLTPIEAAPRSRWVRLALLGMVAVLALGLAVWVNSGRSAEPVRVAVVPIPNQAGSVMERTSELFIAQIAAGVERLPGDGLQVRRWNLAWIYNAERGRVEEHGKDLGIHYLLESDVHLTGNRATLSLHLFRVEDGTLLWSREIPGTEPTLEEDARLAAQTAVAALRKLSQLPERQ